MRFSVYYWQIVMILLISKGYFIASTENPVLAIEDGPIQGRAVKTIGGGNNYYVFQGIPYAKPPLGDLRFQPPVRNDKWNNTLLTNQDKSECTQGANPVLGSEDCLYINVYTPSLSESKQAVMVWIHGGYFRIGDSKYDSFGPDYFLDEGIVFVSFNYRLGIFGFLSTEDLVCPGNNGLKDQVFALRWVQRNIRFFGGDPKNVTIFGESAGSASVSYLLQSPTTKGLYKAAIMESGTSLCLWALDRIARNTAFQVGNKLKVNTTNSQSLVNGLKTVDYKSLQTTANSQFSTNPLAGLTLAPVKELYHKGAFFFNYSDVLLSKGIFQRVPTIIGLNQNEGASFAYDIPGILYAALVTYDLLPSRLAPADLTNNPVKRILAGNEIRYKYFGLLSIALQRSSIIKFATVDQFIRPIERTVLDMVNYAPVYFYKFAYEGQLGFTFIGQSNRTYPGPGHGEEMGYLFRGNNTNPSSNDTLIRSRMIKLWTNFAKYSNPTPVKDPLLQNVTWLNAGTVPGNLLYLNIDLEVELGINPFNTDMRFYDGIYSRYGDPPYNTY